MTALTEVFVTVKPDMNKFGPEVKKKLTAIDTRKEGSRVAGRFGVGFNGAFGGIVKHSAGLFVGAFAAIKGVQFLTGFINDARESAKVARVSAQVIRSTGGVAGITADQMGDLATAISNKTGADDEAVQSGENLLATFTNVRNETGKNNDIFNRASQAAVDMASAMNNGVVDANGLKAANIQLGKALNDPVKGVTALSKVGVSFTAQQKTQIKTLVDSGKTLEAQKIILGEVGKEFGGAAAAAADPLTRLQTIAGNLAEQVGGFLLPVVDRFAGFLGDKVVPAVSSLFDLLKTGDFTSEFAQAFNVGEDSGFVDFLLNARTTAISVFTEIKGGFIAFAEAWKANDGDITSSGFPGFMERLAFAAHTAFDFFKAEVLPRLRDFAGYVIGTVVPAIVTLAGNLISTFGPAVKDVFGFFKTEVLPRLSEFARFLGSSVLPKVGELASALSKNKDFLVPFVAVLLSAVVVFKAVTLAVRAWAAVQALLNIVMTANPIGLVVVAVAALVAGIIYAYKHSEKFREILQGAFKGIQSAAQTFAPLVKAAIDIVIGVFSLWWNYFAKPILTAFWSALKFAWGQAQAFGRIVTTAFNAIKEPARAAIAYVVARFLDFVGSILDAAAKAFGWVPKLGPKLKTAAAEFGKFKDSVNNKLAGINDQTVNVEIKYSSKGVNLTAPSSVGRYADGGGVFGGTRGKDSVPALLMPDEHVWTTREVAAAGGHGAMARMRQAALRGDLRGYAAGGPVGFDVRTKVPSATALAREVATHALRSAGPYIAAGAKQLAAAGPSGPPGARHSFRGVTLNTRTINMLLSAERILRHIFHITQGSYSTRVAASGGTHAGGGVMDTNDAGAGWLRAQNALRSVGFAAWWRHPWQGPWGNHIHSVALGDSSASPAAKAQMASFRRGGDGLGGAVNNAIGRGMRLGGPVLFDRGGQWKSGTVGVNLSGKTETVIPGDGEIRLHRDSVNAIADAVAARPLVMDGRRLDAALSSSALGRGY